MQILSVTLTNFKTHRDRHFEFQPGTNAICGENGAGKTSILEAIAWALFNYQGSYRREDLIRNGSSSTQVMIAFVSSRDGRTYEVQRCTSKGYTLFDPQLNQRLPYTHYKEDVAPWLRQHLGVPPGTDLGQLFANTIGVPQGTFTADFLLSTEKRKPIFDTVLKVEEYRAVYQQTNSLRKYAEAQSQRLKDQIAQYEETLQSWDALQSRYQTVQQEIVQAETQLQQCQAQLHQLQTQKLRLQLQQTQLQEAQQRLQTATSQAEVQQQRQLVLDQARLRSQQARSICEVQQPAREAFLAAEAQLQTLAQQQQAQKVLLAQQQQAQKALSQRQANLARLQLQLEQFEQIEAELSSLADGTQTQQRLEVERTQLQQQLQTITQARLQQQQATAQQQSLIQEIAQLDQKIQQLQALAAVVESIPDWEQQRDRVQQQLSRIAAAQQFAADLETLLRTGRQQQQDYEQQVAVALQGLDALSAEVPTAADAVGSVRTAIASGQRLTQSSLNGIQEILQDLTQQVNQARLSQQLKTLQTRLQQGYRQRAELATLIDQQAQRNQRSQQQQQLEIELAELTQILVTEPDLKVQQAELTQALHQLGDPKGRSRLLQDQLREQPQVRQQYSQLQQTQTNIEQRLRELETELEAFNSLDAAVQQQQQQRQTHQAGYLLYVQNQQTAEQLPQHEADYQAVISTLADLQAQVDQFQTHYQTLSDRFDPQALIQTEQQYSELKSQADQISGSLPQQRKIAEDLTSRIATLQETAQKRDRAQADLKQRERAKRFVNFARKVYKEAGPRITERYVQSISREADRLFRDLLNRSNVALTWSRDYEITVQEGEHSRRFVNLSGGEQMCAALAVRLALLKVLADIDIAFFDEPTTNMDRQRRESLAEAIARIRSFKQLFVISHDDTFEKVTENVIIVERDGDA